MSDLIITVKSSDFISNIDEIYKYSFWKLCSDLSGNDIIKQSADESKSETIFQISKDLINLNQTYYLFVKYIGSLTSSDWSTPIEIQFKEKQIINSIELNFKQCYHSAKSLDSYLNMYFDGTQIEYKCDYDNLYYNYDFTNGISVRNGQMLHTTELSSQIQTKLFNYTIIDPNISSIFTLYNVFKPKKIFIKGYFQRSTSYTHTLLLRFTGNISREEYYVFAIINNYSIAICPDESDAFYCDNMNSKLDLITLDNPDNYFEYEFTTDQLTHCFTNSKDTAFTVDLINPYQRWIPNNSTLIYNGPLYLTDLKLYSENYLEPTTVEYTPALYQFAVPFISNKITLLALPYNNNGTFADKIQFKITKDKLGNNIITEFEKDYIDCVSCRLFEYIDNDILYNTTYYGFVRYHQNNSEYTNWSRPVKIILSEPITTKSGRLVYRHWTDCGTILETKTNNKDDNIIILDSAYRMCNDGVTYPFGMFKKDSSLPNITVPDRMYVNGSSSANFNNVNLPIINDTQFDSYWCSPISSTDYNGYDPNTAKYNCDTWLKYEKTTDSSGTVGVPLVRYVRTITNFNIKSDVPNTNQLTKIFIEAESIDQIELQSLNKHQISFNYLFGRSNPNGFWTFKNGTKSSTIFISSTENSSNYCLAMMSTGLIYEQGNKQSSASSNLGIVPIIEEFNFKENITVNTPIISISLNDCAFDKDEYNITFTSSSFISNINQLHGYSNWKLCSDITGDTIIIEDKNSSDLLSHKFDLSNIDLIDNTYYYIFVQYIGAYDGISNWSDPVRLIYSSNIVKTPSGRYLYRHPSNFGTVMEYNDEGSMKHVLVLDARYRYRGYKFGIYETDSSLPNLTYNVAITPDNVAVQKDDILPVISDTDINSTFNFNTNTSKQNCDIWMTYSGVTDSDNTIGCPPVEYCRNININGMSCDLPNLQILSRIYAEQEELDKLDPTASSNPTLAFAPIASDSNHRFAMGAFSSVEASASDINILFYNAIINNYPKNEITQPTFGSSNFITIPVLELFSNVITTPTINSISCNDINNPNCILHIKSSAFISAITIDHIKTNVKIYSDSSANNIIYKTSITLSNLNENESLTNFNLSLNSNIFNDSQTYYVSIQYETEGHYSIYSATKSFTYYDSILFSEHGRKLYRHVSNQGTVLEFVDKSSVLRKIVVLDAKYRSTGKFGTYGTDSTLTNLTSTNGNNNTYIDGISKYSPGEFPLITDSKINTIWTTLDNKTSKQNCDVWSGYDTPGVLHCRSININNTNAEVPNFNASMRIMVESANINLLDPTISEYPQYSIGTDTGFVDITTPGNMMSSTEYSNIYIQVVTKRCNTGVNSKDYILAIIPIIEITESTISKPSLVFSGLYKTETNYKLIIQYLPISSTTITTQYSKLEYILKDSSNTNIISQDIVNITDISQYKTEIELPLSLELDIESVYNLQFAIISEFDDIVKSPLSDLIEINFPKTVPNANLPSGRKLYRHESDIGSVLEFIDQGILRKVLVLDAQYRSLNERFGLYNVDVGLPIPATTANIYNKYGKASIFGEPIDLISLNTIPILTDDNFDNLNIGSCDPNTSKYNCDQYMKFKDTTDTLPSSYGGPIKGCPAVQYCRNIKILGTKCDLPNISVLARIFLEADNIDKLDKSSSTHSTNLLGFSNPNGIWLGGLTYSIYAWTSTVSVKSTSNFSQRICYFNTTLQSLSLSQTHRGSGYSNQVSYDKSVKCPVIPILELIDNAIEIPSIILIKTLDNSTLIANSSQFNSKMTEDHLSTSWKICSDENGENIIESSLNDTQNLLSFTFNSSKSLVEDSIYYVFVQYHGSYTTNSGWSKGYKLIYKINYIYSKSGRLLYRHESNEGTVLEYDQFGKHHKILILDAKYRFSSVFGLQGIHTGLTNVPYYNINSTSVIDGSSNNYNLLTDESPTVTDAQIEKIWPNNTFDVNTPRQNGDILMHYDTTVDTKNNIGPVAVMRARNIIISSMHADLPTVNELYPIALELKNIDDLDPSLNNYTQNRLFPTTSDNGLKFTNAEYPYVQSTTPTTYVSNDDGSLRIRVLESRLALSYTQKLYKISSLPIIDISDEFIDKPEIIFSSGYVLNNSKNVFVKTNPKIPTNSDQIIGSIWKLCSDKDGLNILAQDEVDDNSIVHHFQNIENLTDGEVYFVFVKFKYVLFGYTDWSDYNVFIFSKYGTPGGRKLYRHESDMGSVLEYYDTSWKKIIVLDAMYRDSLQFGAYNVDVSTLTKYTNYYHIQPNPPYVTYKHCIHGLDATYIYSSDGQLPIQMSDLELNTLWVNSIDSKTAKYNCDQWMTKNSYTDSQSIKGVPAVAHCRSIMINENPCDLPNIQQLMRIYVEADFIDSLDPTITLYPTKALGLRNPNGFWKFSETLNLAVSSTDYSKTGIRIISSAQGCSYISKTRILNVIPILEI